MCLLGPLPQPAKRHVSMGTEIDVCQEGCSYMRLGKLSKRPKSKGGSIVHWVSCWLPLTNRGVGFKHKNEVHQVGELPPTIRHQNEAANPFWFVFLFLDQVVLYFCSLVLFILGRLQKQSLSFPQPIPLGCETCGRGCQNQ